MSNQQRYIVTVPTDTVFTYIVEASSKAEAVQRAKERGYMTDERDTDLVLWHEAEVELE